MQDDLGLEIFKQCHEHLRETDKKRDQLVAFYAVIVGLLFAGLDPLSKLHVLGDIRALVAAGVGVIGLACTFALVAYRRWHVKYVNYIVVLQACEVGSKPLTKKALKDAWTPARVKPRFWRNLNPLSVEFWTFLVFVAFSWLPWQVYIQLACGSCATASPLRALLWNLALYGGMLHLLAMIALWDATRRIDEGDWLMRGLPDDPK